MNGIMKKSSLRWIFIAVLFDLSIICLDLVLVHAYYGELVKSWFLEGFDERGIFLIILFIEGGGISGLGALVGAGVAEQDVDITQFNSNQNPSMALDRLRERPSFRNDQLSFGLKMLIAGSFLLAACALGYIL